jgi:magnesium transporter
VVAIPAEASVLDACEFFVLHRLLAFPVVDSAGRFVGTIDVELYTDGVRDLGEKPHDDLFELVGIHLARARQRGPLDAFRIRFPWLVCNIVGGIMAAFLCGLFQEQIRNAVALAFFVPVVLALAESVSIQSVSLTVQILRDRPPSWKAIWRKLRGELAVGLLLGLGGGLIVALAALAWLGHLRLAICVLDGIVAGVTVAAMLGATVPSLLHRLRLDPRVAAGPVVLAITDVITLVCYFNVARWLLR